MGGGASVPAAAQPDLSEAGKAALFTHLKASDLRRENRRNNGEDEKAVLTALKETYAARAKELEEAEKGPVGVPPTKEDAELSEEEALATAAAFADKFGGGGAEAMSGTKTSDFRKRRLSVTSGQATAKVSVAADGRKASTVMYRSQEIGAAPSSVPLPFPDAKVGTYSCHGVEPSYNEEEGVTAKINQDRGCVVYPFNDDPRHALFSVFDGHGEHGDVVSHFVMHEIQSCLAAHPSLTDDPPTALKECYIKVNESLANSKAQEATFSGTTAVSVLMREGQLWIANAGDSRAVLAVSTGDAEGEGGGGGGLKAVDLSVDQNPDSPLEKARIEAAGGFVSPPPEPGLSSRVWLDAAMTQIGLAMARSIGDHAVKSIGVVAEPEVTDHTIKEEDKFLVLASDGVWEFISSQEAIDIVNAGLDQGTMKATQDLIEAAATKWREVEGDYRDDITAVVVRLPCFPE